MGLTGGAAHVRRLRKLGGPDVIKRVNQVLFVGADIIKAEAQHLITAGSVSGKQHKSSPPGTPPHNNSGVLKSNIETSQPAPLVAQVSSNAPYAAIQEFGGTIQHPGGTPYFMRDGKPVFVSNRGAGAFHNLPKTKPHEITLPSRPYIRPARDNKIKEINKLFADAIESLVKESG